MRPPPVTFWLYVLSELWRLILLTTCILVIVLSFAAAVRFLADGRLGPIETIRLMFLMMPPMLQYALPFAAGLGATLAYHRCCIENETTAAHAAGVSHRAVLAPALVSGLVLAGVLLLLSNLVIPRFLRSTEELLTRDAARIIINAIEHKEAVKMENTLLYADLIRRSPDTGDGAYERLYMQGVFAVELDKSGKVKFQMTAKEADVWLMRVARATEGESTGTETLVIVKSRGMEGQSGERRGTAETNVIARSIPNSFSDDPKFKSWDDLQRLRSDPDRLNVIDSRRRVLAAHLAERATTDMINALLRSDGRVSFEAGDESGVTLFASGVRWIPEPPPAPGYWDVLPPGGAAGAPGKIVIERRLGTGRLTRQEAQSATFHTRVDPDSPDHEVRIDMVLRDLSAVPGAAPGKPGASAQVRSQPLGDLSVVPNPAGSLMVAPSGELLSRADQHLEQLKGDEYVQRPRDDLRNRITDLMREITSKQHERFASAAACLVMVLTGAIMAIRLKAKLPLEIYLWAFFPALATVITISAGQQMIHSKGMVGVPIMWAGVAGLAAYTFVQYRRVARN